MSDHRRRENVPDAGEGHWASDCPGARAGGSPLPREHAAKQERESAPSRCFHCQQRGHFAANCPNNAALYCEGEDRIDVSTPRRFKKGIHRCGVVEGVRVNGILLDTGATQSMVREDLVPPDRRADGETTITCAHGDRVVYPLTAVSVGVGSQHLVVRAGVSRTLPVPVLLAQQKCICNFDILLVI